VAPLAHDASVLENPEVLRNRRPADVEIVRELVHAVRLAEQVLEDRPPRGIGHRPENNVRVGPIGNHMVTYYSYFADGVKAQGKFTWPKPWTFRLALRSTCASARPPRDSLDRGGQLAATTAHAARRAEDPGGGDELLL